MSNTNPIVLSKKKTQLCEIHKTKQRAVKLPDGSIAWYCKRCNTEMNKILGMCFK